MSKSKNLSGGFTLIEISIVLVVIGLIIGGIFLGQSLIQTAKINQLAKQIQKYNIALDTFKLKYNDIPGDMKNATDYWPAVAVSCTTAAGTGTQTCNGNGNGRIGNVLTAENYEVFRFWQHLKNAELIDSPVTGVAGSNGYREALVGVNVPVSTFDAGAGFSITTIDEATTALYPTSYFSTQAGTSFTIGKIRIFNYLELYGPWFSGFEMSSLDKKIDDGRAGLGIIFGSPNSATWVNQCTTTNDPNTTMYNLDDTTKRCHVNYKLDF